MGSVPLRKQRIDIKITKLQIANNKLITNTKINVLGVSDFEELIIGYYL